MYRRYSLLHITHFYDTRCELKLQIIDLQYYKLYSIMYNGTIVYQHDDFHNIL